MSFSQKVVEIDGVSYTLQKIPFKSALDITDRCTNKHGILMKAPYSAELLKHCVVSPKVDMSSFDEDMSAGMELVSEIESFLGSKPEPDGGKEKSKE